MKSGATSCVPPWLSGRDASRELCELLVIDMKAPD